MATEVFRAPKSILKKGGTNEHDSFIFYLSSSQANVYVIDELTGGLELSHVLALSAKDFPGAPGK
jgi:hypothetical protein